MTTPGQPHQPQPYWQPPQPYPPQPYQGYPAQGWQPPAGQPWPQPVYVAPPHIAASVTATRRDTNHTFHLIMTIITCGFWGMLVWLPLTLWHKIGPKKKVVTRHQ